MAVALAKIRPFKFVLIIALMAAAIYQTGRLWFIDIVNRGFFYALTSAVPATPDQYAGVIKPYRIVTGAGDGYFNIIYNNIAGEDVYDYAGSVIAAAIRSGEYAGTQAADYDKLLKKPVCVFEYAVSIQSEYLLRAFEQRPRFFSSFAVQSFDSVLIQPPTESDENLLVYFINGETAYAYRLSGGNKQEPASRYAFEIKPARDVENKIAYRRVYGEFVPDFAGGESFPSISFTNPYENIHGEKLLSFILSQVEAFFINPARINAGLGADGVFTFSGQHTIVRYTDRDILEYTRYSVIDRSADVSFVIDFSAAQSFINTDANVINEAYLADFELEDGRHTFRFNYAVGNVPLSARNGWPDRAEIVYPIEMTVDHGLVIRYRKLAYNFYIEGE